MERIFTIAFEIKWYPPSLKREDIADISTFYVSLKNAVGLRQKYLYWMGEAEQYFAKKAFVTGCQYEGQSDGLKRMCDIRIPIDSTIWLCQDQSKIIDGAMVFVSEVLHDVRISDEGRATVEIRISVWDNKGRCEISDPIIIDENGDRR